MTAKTLDSWRYGVTRGEELDGSCDLFPALFGTATFKAQNMSNSSCSRTPGGEIGRAQVEQAQAYG